MSPWDRAVDPRGRAPAANARPKRSSSAPRGIAARQRGSSTPWSTWTPRAHSPRPAPRRAGCRRASGSALAGVPVAVKDNIDVGGQMTAAGSGARGRRSARSRRRRRDAACAAADAIMLGRANMDELAMGASTQTSANGPTRNPLDHGAARRQQRRLCSSRRCRNGAARRSGPIRAARSASPPRSAASSGWLRRRASPDATAWSVRPRLRHGRSAGAHGRGRAASSAVMAGSPPPGCGARLGIPASRVAGSCAGGQPARACQLLRLRLERLRRPRRARCCPSRCRRSRGAGRVHDADLGRGAPVLRHCVARDGRSEVLRRLEYAESSFARTARTTSPRPNVQHRLRGQVAEAR